MRAIYFCSSKNSVKNVYPPELHRKLADLYGMEEEIYDASALGKEDFSEVELIFSTWGMIGMKAEDVKKYFPNLKGVFYGAGSVQGFARNYLAAGVKVFSAWQANAVPVVEFTLAQILLANKGYFQSTARLKNGYPSARDFFYHFQGNYGAKVGILGDGAIGSKVIDRLKEYRLEVYVYSITMTEEEAAKKGVKLATLREIFSECDVISNHLANNPQTVGMINGELLSRMKDYATFINTGRGAQVDEPALIEVLQNNPTITALLDVTNPEPPEEGSPLYSLPNAFLTPHIAGSAGKEVARMGEYMIEESQRFLAGEPCPFEVTEKMLETMA